MSTGLPSFLYAIGKNLILRSFWLFVEFSVLAAIRVSEIHVPCCLLTWVLLLGSLQFFFMWSHPFSKPALVWQKVAKSLSNYITIYAHGRNTGMREKHTFPLICPNRVVTLQKPFLPPLWWLWCNMITPQVHGSRDKKLV